jgi:hypothetical protein
MAMRYGSNDDITAAVVVLVNEGQGARHSPASGSMDISVLHGQGEGREEGRKAQAYALQMGDTVSTTAATGMGRYGVRMVTPHTRTATS